MINVVAYSLVNRIGEFLRLLLDDCVVIRFRKRPMPVHPMTPLTPHERIVGIRDIGRIEIV